MIPIVRIRHANYENVIADCHWCGYECTFNRASDIGTFEPIWGRDIQCLNESCQKPFRIISDNANERHEMLVFDCHQLLERKQYMYCILNLTMAYEMFFSLYLRVELLYKPFVVDPNCKASEKLKRMNRLSKKLDDKTRRWTYDRMRIVFLSQITDQRPVPDLGVSERRIDCLKARSTTECEINALNDARLSPLLICLKRTDINRVRNAVVHKRGYRPTSSEVKKYLEETRSVLLGLSSHLNLHDDLNYWIHGRSQP